MHLCQQVEALEPRLLFSAGGVDPYFGTSGRVVLWTDEVRPEHAAMLVYPDGRILTVVSDRLNPETREMHVRRLNSDGSPDLRFGGNGSVVLQFPDTFSNATHLALTGDGRVVVSDGDHVARLRGNGSPDPMFGSNGILDLQIPTSDIEVLADGSMLVLTTPTEQPEVVFDAMQLIRFRPDGSPDTTYGNGGNVIATIPRLLDPPEPHSGPAIFELKLVTSPDGSAFALCRFDEFIPDTDEDVNGIYIARFTPAGTPDTRFNGTGVLHLADRAPQNRRNVLPAGSTIESFAARLAPDGQLLVLVDTAWEDVAFRVSDHGDVVPNPAPARMVDEPDENREDGPLALDALVTRDGGVVVGRNSNDVLGNARFRLRKWNNAGTPVAEFDTGAPAISPLGDTLQLASAADGSIVLLDNEFKSGGKVLVLRRLWSDGAPVGDAGAEMIRESGSRSQVITVTYRDDERLDVSTFDGRDVRVTGPDGYAAFAKFDRIVKRRGDGGWVRVRYKLAAPGGAWDASDNGTYRLQLRAGQVFDNDGRAAAPGRLGAFGVSIASAASTRAVAKLDRTIVTTVATARPQAIDIRACVFGATLVNAARDGDNDSYVDKWIT